MDALQTPYEAALRQARSGRYPEALQTVDAELARDPAQAPVLALKAALLLELGQPDQALACCEAALAIDPVSARVHSNRGDALRRLNRLSEALASYDRALELQPSYFAALVNRGNALLDVSRPAQALESFDAALRLDPRNASAHSNRACALTELSRQREALEAADQALAIDPRFAKAWKNRGDALLGLQEPQAALESHQTALRLDPQLYDASVGMAAALKMLRRYEDAIAALAAAERLRPGFPMAVFQRSTLRLLLGDFEGGWADYEARWKVPNFLANATGFVTPDVLSKRSAGLAREDVAGRRVLLAAEQGIGDQLMYLSMLPDLLALASGVTCICDRRLVGLLSHSFPDVLFFDSRDGVPANFGRYDLVMATGDLGRLFRNAVSDFPGEAYVRPRPDVTAAWAERLGPRRKTLRVGLSWRGGTERTNREGRSIPLDHLRRLLNLGDCEFVSLQYGDPTAEVEAVTAALGADIRIFPPAEIDDFEQLAGLVANLDLVVSVQTAIVHLCGALGAPCLTLVPMRPEWRYGAVGERLPWYGSIRILRQAGTGSWAPVVEEAVERVAAQGGAAPSAAAPVTLPREVLDLKQRGDRLTVEQRPEEAVGQYDQALALAPDQAFLLAARAGALGLLGQFDAALESADRALATQPAYAMAWKSRGDALLGLKRLPEAVETFTAAAACDPKLYEAQTGLGRTYRALGRYEQGIAALDDAAELDPVSPVGPYLRGLLRLTIGDFEAGWRDYRHRWDVEGFVAQAAAFVTPEIRARLARDVTAESLAERKVLVVCEQGAGDQLMFLSLLPDLLGAAASVTCICDRRMVGLLSHSFPAVRFLDSRDTPSPDLDAFDLIVAAGTLAGAYRNRAADFPGTPYLRPDPARVDAWARTLGSRRGRLRIGLSWRGGTRMTDRRGRSIPLMQLRSLLGLQDVEFVSLQYGDPAAEVRQARSLLGCDIRLFPPADIDDFGELAALVANLDLVVSVQTAVVHLCGALGTPCLALVPVTPEWRYTASSATMPWYRSVRLIRQDGTQSWAPVVDRARQAVVEKLANPA